MNVLIFFILIGILVVSRAVYVAQKIKKKPETTKYGNNPKTAIVVMAVVGVISFFGGIGFAVSGALKPSVYTFVNNSSFPITILPEYGDDFQIQPKSTKSFESKHSTMVINYGPSDYVESDMTKGNHFTFTNKNLYFDENRGFVIFPPDSWQIMNYPGLVYKVIIGEAENNFAPNMNFIEENNPFTQFFTYVDVSSQQMQDSGTRIISRDKFTTDRRMDGIKIETNTETLLQIYYIFDTGKQTVFIVTCSAPLKSEIDYSAVFDSSVRTLEFTY
jgi:hypothetical protein